jgi:hypothetical protein
MPPYAYYIVATFSPLLAVTARAYDLGMRSALPAVTPQDPELIEAKYLKDLELDIAFVFPAFFDYPSEYLGREVVEGTDTHKLGVTLPLGVRLTTIGS